MMQGEQQSEMAAQLRGAAWRPGDLMTHPGLPGTDTGKDVVMTIRTARSGRRPVR
jgi:hypothetical protein